ncbi:MAG: hypothetical protein BGO78_06200 [Chloroflexi bacterium 44-23]|nr:MAG: hypothetical protein BGO78_06200 [Chloroflexi bacterium 44-23]
MPKKEYDAVLEAIRVDENNQLSLARIYKKHGAIWSDLFVVDREELIKRMKAGQRFVLGTRIHQLGSTFDTGKPLYLASFEENGFIRLDQEHISADYLPTVPRF